MKFSIVGFLELSALTESNIGKPVGADGRVYGDLSQLTAASTTCVGVLAYSGSAGHGYIIALQNSANDAWPTVNGYSAYSGAIAAASGSKVVPSGSYNDLTSYTKLGSTDVSNWVVFYLFASFGRMKRDRFGTR
ncbi:MAG: hypothetical protein IJ618_07445 [Prevotella sp.]|nr:hypothetical protein [Prevotella sp.]